MRKAGKKIKFINKEIIIYNMKLLKKAKIPGIVSLIIIVLVVILLVYLVKNGWSIQEAVKDMLSLFGAGAGKN